MEGLCSWLLVGNIQIPAQDIEICIKTGFSSDIELDVTAYLLAQGTLKVRVDQEMIFYGQTSNLQSKCGFARIII